MRSVIQRRKNSNQPEPDYTDGERQKGRCAQVSNINILRERRAEIAVAHAKTLW